LFISRRTFADDHPREGDPNHGTKSIIVDSSDIKDYEEPEEVRSCCPLERRLSVVAAGAFGKEG
jgi:hypothetical protein